MHVSQRYIIIINIGDRIYIIFFLLYLLNLNTIKDLRENDYCVLHSNNIDLEGKEKK
jgi:hypothetical protein